MTLEIRNKTISEVLFRGRPLHEGDVLVSLKEVEISAILEMNAFPFYGRSGRPDRTTGKIKIPQGTPCTVSYYHGAGGVGVGGVSLEFDQSLKRNLSSPDKDYYIVWITCAYLNEHQADFDREPK